MTTPQLAKLPEVVVPHPERAAEQAYLDRARQALVMMAERTRRALADTGASPNEADGEVARWHLQRRLDSLATREDLVAFGRIEDRHDCFYVGRRHIENPAGEPLVVDWRAPVSIPFYRATIHDPLGLDRRRRYTGDGLTVVDVIEEDFNDPDGGALSGGVPDPLLAELDRERTGTMRDIVATIAAEQDEVIRAPLNRLLIVQGGPGTGKTAVALHRAAYLLFEHRRELLETGVLVIGPNPVFLQYVADVLPSLGETAVRQTTIDGLRPSTVRVEGEDPEAVGVLKGDSRMATVLSKVLADGIRLPEEAIAISTAWGVVRLQVEEVARVVAEVQARDAPFASRKEGVRNQLLHIAYETHARSAEVPALKANFTAAARADAGFKKMVDRVWPVPVATAVVARLFTNRAVRQRAAAGILDADEEQLLARPMAGRSADQRWTPADVALIDEVEYLLNGVRTTYGHIVVDEAQDLSSMALRMLGRRCSSGSLTVVGDLAQGTRPWAQRSWSVVADTLHGAAPVQFSELTVGYRTPAPMLDLANRLLVEAAPDVTPARSVRQTGRAPRMMATDDVAATAAALVVEFRGERGTVAVIAVEAIHGDLAAALGAAAVPWGAGAHGLGEVALLTPLVAKGLEFDAVVVVEPAQILTAEAAGARALFVALTRATRDLAVVYALALPTILAADAAPESRR